jgi:hypothetical protein
MATKAIKAIANPAAIFLPMERFMKSTFATGHTFPDHRRCQTQTQPKSLQR